MESVMEYWGVLILAVGFGIAFFAIRHTRRKNFDMLSQMAVRRGGTVRKGFIFGYPVWNFPYGSFQVEVHSTPGSKNSPPKTRVSCPLSLGKEFEVHVSREHLFTKALKLVGVQDIELGNDAFDKAFMVKGDDEFAAKAILNPSVQERLLRLPGRGMSLSLSAAQLKLAVHTIPSSEQDYEPILDAFTAVLDVLKAGHY